tara:strand:- start:2602 stop:2757 length:156 start_codon:yes stop_codon:yes gene_type:complete
MAGGVFVYSVHVGNFGVLVRESRAPPMGGIPVSTPPDLEKFGGVPCFLETD